MMHFKVMLDAKTWPNIHIFNDLDFQETEEDSTEVRLQDNLDSREGGGVALDKTTMELLQIQEQRNLKSEQETGTETETETQRISEAELPSKIKAQLEKGRYRIAYIMSKILIFKYQSQSASNLIQHAKIQIKLNMEDLALIVMKKAYKRYPASSKIARLLGLLLLHTARKSQDYRECFSLLIKSSALLKNYQELTQVLNFEKLICSLLIKDKKNVEKYLKRSKFTLNSSLEDSFYLYCVRLSENQFYRHSLRVLEVVLKTIPNARQCDSYIFALCWLLYQTDQWLKCLNIFENYQFKEPQMANIGQIIVGLARSKYHEKELDKPFIPQAPGHIESFHSELESKYGSNEITVIIKNDHEI